MRQVTSPEAPARNETVVTTTTKQILPAQNRSTVDFWPYVESLKPEDWSKHIVYIYRTDPRVSMYGDGASSLEKITGFFEISPGRQIPFNSREEVELAIREKHGGKAFRLILKRGSERIAEEKCSNDFPPRYVHMMPGANSGAGNPSGTPYDSASATADVAKVAMSTMAGQERAATETAVRALEGASNVILRMSQGTQPAPPSAMDQAMQAMMVEIMRRAMNPPPAPDPIDQIAKIAALVGQLNGGANSGLGPLAPVVTKFIETASERVFSPITTTPTASAAAELVRQLPGVAGYVTQAIREWRAGVEAQRDTAAFMTGHKPPTPPTPAQPPPQPIPTQLPKPPGGEITMPSLEFIEVKIIEIIEEGHAADDAADDILSFIDRMDAALPAQLHTLGEAGLLNLFQTRPILQPAIKNMPRLVEIIRAILRLTEPKPTSSSPSTIEGNPQNG